MRLFGAGPLARQWPQAREGRAGQCAARRRKKCWYRRKVAGHSRSTGGWLGRGHPSHPLPAIPFQPREPLLHEMAEGEGLKEKQPGHIEENLVPSRQANYSLDEPSTMIGVEGFWAASRMSTGCLPLPLPRLLGRIALAPMRAALTD